MSLSAEQLLLTEPGLTIADCQQAVAAACPASADWAELFLQRYVRENWVLENRMIRQGGYHESAGFGLRTMAGKETGFAYADELSVKAFADAAKHASSIVAAGGSAAIKQAARTQAASLYAAIDPMHGIADADKVAVLHRIDQTLRAAEPALQEVVVSMHGEYDVIAVFATDGTLAFDVRPLVQLRVRVTTNDGEHYEAASSGWGGRYDYHQLINQASIQQFCDKALHQLQTNLRAVSAPAGTMPVVLGGGWPAVLLHEAVGHGFEGDFIRHGSSAFAGKLGEQVAAPGVTVVDDGTLADRRGSLTIDDEGTPTQRTVLIENGMLKNYMYDKHNAQLMGVNPTGNGRRESYGTLPLPRMTNTYMEAGSDNVHDMIASIEHGIYAVDFSGGQVDITSGQFVFTTSEAYKIEKGQVKEPVKNATLIGSGPEVIQRISMVGNDFALDSGIGVCGKAGQSVEVGVGQPSVKVDQIIVGGAE